MKVPYNDSPTSLPWLGVRLTLQGLSGSIKEPIQKQTNKNHHCCQKDYLNYRDTLPVVLVKSYHPALFPQDTTWMLVTVHSKGLFFEF